MENRFHWFQRRGRRRAIRFVLGGLLGCLISFLSCNPAWSNLPLQQAQHFNTQGQYLLQTGNPEAALDAWRQAETLYRTLGDQTGIIGTQLNQAKALQASGFYRRARVLLESLQPLLQQQPDRLRLNGLLTLGNVLRLVGELEDSQSVLEQSLALAQRSLTRADMQAALLQLGNTLLAQENPGAALNYFQQATAISGPARLTAQLRQFKLLLQQDVSQALSLLPQIYAQLDALPHNQAALYERIDLADSLMAAPEQLSLKSEQQPFSLLMAAAEQANTLGDRRAESHALGRLGHWYEQRQQWREAQRFTQAALHLAREAQAADIAYRWQWQMGRMLQTQGDSVGAIVAYTQAVETLQALRNDLVAIGQEVQVSFREQVEPVYRELVSLLLAEPSPSQQHLQQARQVIEWLQLAELNNFFREACLEAKPQLIDQIDSTAAVIYPIILPDRLEVILSLPGQPLTHYATQLSQPEVEAGIQRMAQSLRPTSFAQERLAVAQEIYRWLLQPAASDLAQSGIQTLVFVLDGSLRNLPMAALYDGHHYLIEHYRIAITPGLQVMNSRPLSRDRLRALVGGLSEARQGFASLPEVNQEIQQIRQEIPATVLANQGFTATALKQWVKTTPFAIVHLATHGQFGSRAKDTFILTWDGRINVNELQALLMHRDVPDSAAIELLVLSACQTAQGDSRAALGMAGVAVRSGARSTLATLWTVNDTSTATLVTQFYQSLVQPGTTRAEAVRQAQLTLLKQPEFSHPYYWAPFILVGNWL